MHNSTEWPLLFRNFFFYKILNKKNLNFNYVIKKKKGIIHVDKPWGYNSYEILSWLKRKCYIRQVNIFGFIQSRITGCLLIFLGKPIYFKEIEYEQKTNYVIVYRKIFNSYELDPKKPPGRKKNYCFKDFFLFSLQKKQIDMEKISFFWNKENTSDSGIIEISLAYGSIINSLIINLTYIMSNKIKFLEIRKIRNGNFLEEDGQVSFHDILDSLWIKNCLMKNFCFQKMIIPQEIFWSNYRRILIKNSHVNHICYGKNLRKIGIIKIEVSIEKGEKILILNNYGEPVAIGKMKVNFSCFLRKNSETVIDIKMVLMKKNNSKKKFKEDDKIMKKNIGLTLGLTNFFKKKKFRTIKWWSNNIFL